MENAPHLEKVRAARVRQQAIGRELRRIYDTVAQEPVPNEFMDLLKRMDEGAQYPSVKGST